MSARWASLALLLALAGCAGPRLPPLTAEGFAPGPEEEGMWRLSEELARVLERQGALIREPAVDAYLTGVLRRLVPDDGSGRLHLSVHVLDASTPNAFACANGSIYVSAGLLADLENEAQLSALLGHEASHVLNRHAFSSRLAALRNATVAIFTLGIGYKPALAAQAGYSRDQERDADAQGIDLMVRAGYAPSEALRFFERLDLVAREEKTPELGWLASHPSSEERIANARSRSATAPGDSENEVGTERFRAAVHPVLLRASELAFASRLLVRAERRARSLLEANPNEARAWVLLGDISRFGQDDLEEAARRYRRAIAVAPDCADAERALGRTLLRSGDLAGARAALLRYRDLRPNAVDRSFIEAELHGIAVAP